MDLSTFRRRRIRRTVGLTAAIAFFWSFVLAMPAQAAAQFALQPHKRLGVRVLTEQEAARIYGSVHVVSCSLASCPTFPSTSKFYHTDALGSTRGITNGSQTVTDTMLHDAFGMTVTRTGSTATPFGFVGASQYQSDGDSGLQLLGNRMYDPSVGRFISSDPIQAGDNWYSYCENGPLSATDPNGLDELAMQLKELAKYSAPIIVIPGLNEVAVPIIGVVAVGVIGWSFRDEIWHGLKVIGKLLTDAGSYGGGYGEPAVGYLNPGLFPQMPVGGKLPGSEYRKPISKEKLEQKPWLADGQYRSGPHVDMDPNNNHGGPHIDFPDRNTKKNHRYPLKGNKKDGTRGPI